VFLFTFFEGVVGDFGLRLVGKDNRDGFRW
jgi:hypothetical protein